MSADAYRREVLRRQQTIAKLQKEKSQESAKAAGETKRAHEDEAAAGRVSSLSSKTSRLRDAQRHHDAAVRHQKKIAELEDKIAREQMRLSEDDKRLRDAEGRELRKRTEDQNRVARDSERKLSAISGQLQQHDQLHHIALSAIKKLQHLPERITVLFLAANPVDQEQLRLDEEARAISEMIRMSEHREAVRLESRWAVRPLDVLQAINECRPSVIHFSGHGSDKDEIIFHDNAGNAKPVSKEALLRLWSRDPTIYSSFSSTPAIRVLRLKQSCNTFRPQSA